MDIPRAYKMKEQFAEGINASNHTASFSANTTKRRVVRRPSPISLETEALFSSFSNVTSSVSDKPNQYAYSLCYRFHGDVGGTVSFSNDVVADDDKPGYLSFSFEVTSALASKLDGRDPNEFRTMVSPYLRAYKLDDYLRSWIDQSGDGFVPLGVPLRSKVSSEIADKMEILPVLAAKMGAPPSCYPEDLESAVPCSPVAVFDLPVFLKGTKHETK